MLYFMPVASFGKLESQSCQARREPMLQSDMAWNQRIDFFANPTKRAKGQLEENDCRGLHQIAEDAPTRGRF